MLPILVTCAACDLLQLADVLLLIGTNVGPLFATGSHLILISPCIIVQFLGPRLRLHGQVNHLNVWDTRNESDHHAPRVWLGDVL